MNATTANTTTATASTTTTTRRPRRGVVLGATVAAAGLVVSLSACGSSGTAVWERQSNSSTSGSAVLQPGTYQLSISCSDKRSTKKVNGKKQKTGATPTASLSTIVNGQQVETDASCSGSDDDQFTLTAPAELRFDASLNGSARYTAKVLLKK